jgi:uncharacterized protein (DUF169 family)
MPLTREDFTIMNKFEFDVQPVGVKYLTERPDRLDLLDEKTTLCGMLKMAQQGKSFYAEPSNHTCGAGLYVLGQADVDEKFFNGEWGAGLQVFKDSRAASRVYSYIPKISKGMVKYVVFSPLNEFSFEPDVLVVMAKTDQAEILLRAMSYANGNMWSSKYSSVIGCAWLLVYPYLSGEINYSTTGLGFGMRRRKLFPQGLQFICIPFDKMPYMLQTLREMPWVPRPYEAGGFEYVEQLRIRLGID